MDSNGSGRRRFLKHAAALAGVAAGAGAGAEWAARGQTAKPGEQAQDAPSSGETLAPRGENERRSHHLLHAAAGLWGNHHPGLAPLRAIPRVPFPRHRCEAASPHDPRHGGSSLEFQHGRPEEPAFGIPGSFRGVPCKQLSHDPWCRQREHGAAGPVYSRDGQLQRMDRRAAFRVVEHGRREKRGELAGLRRGGPRQVQPHRSAGKGHGRRYRGLRPEWRAGASSSRATRSG